MPLCDFGLQSLASSYNRFRASGQSAELPDDWATTSIGKEETMTRLDEVAAVVFVRGLEPETVAAMKTALLRKAGQAQERPDPKTRLGLAFIAFTTKDVAEPTEAEIEQVSERVYSLWTPSEVERLERLDWCG